jgi:hypothetical protein
MVESGVGGAAERNPKKYLSTKNAKGTKACEVFLGFIGR